MDWTWYIIIFCVLILTFYVWTIIDMFSKRRISKREKALWLIAFLVGGILTSIVWLFVRKR